MASRFGRIRGLVLDEQSSAPIGDCVVAVQPESERGGRRNLDSRLVRANAQGAFQFSGLAPGTYELWILSDADAHVVRRPNVRVRSDAETRVEVLFPRSPADVLVPLWLVPDHQRMASQAIKILKNDGNTKQASFISKWLPFIKEGESTADATFIPGLHHFYHWSTGEGKGGQTAAATCMSAASRASSYWSRFRESPTESWLARSAMKYLGEAAHCVEDVCQPHHANLTNGTQSVHAQFESYVHFHYSTFAAGVTKGGEYGYSGTGVRQWVISNAKFACCKYGSLVDSYNESDFSKAAKDVIPQAKRSKAGFFKFFLETRLEGWDP